MSAGGTVLGGRGCDKPEHGWAGMNENRAHLNAHWMKGKCGKWPTMRGFTAAFIQKTCLFSFQEENAFLGAQKRGPGEEDQNKTLCRAPWNVAAKPLTLLPVIFHQLQPSVCFHQLQSPDLDGFSVRNKKILTLLAWMQCARHQWCDSTALRLYSTSPLTFSHNYIVGQQAVLVTLWTLPFFSSMVRFPFLEGSVYCEHMKLAPPLSIEVSYVVLLYQFSKTHYRFSMKSLHAKICGSHSPFNSKSYNEFGIICQGGLTKLKA